MDIAVEGHLRNALANTPYPVIGEELSPDVVAQVAKGCWFLDPIDGSANYLNNIPFYGTSVGFVADSIFSVGAVVFPALHELYFVSDEGNAYLNGIRLQAKDDLLTHSLIGIAFSGKAADHKHRATEFELFGRLNDKSRGCMRTGSAALNVCFVTSGKMQAAVGFNNRIWDVAGAIAIAQKAGYCLYCQIDWAINRISYVVGSSTVAKSIVEEIESSMGIRFMFVPR
jgi:myo-inositol-1(or 4)-monophosphatase